MGGRNIFGRTTRRGQKYLDKAASGSRSGVRSAVAPTSRGFRQNYNPFNILRGRFSNLSAFGAGHGANFYAPNQGGFLAGIGNLGSKDNPRFSGGVIGRLGAISKMERVAERGGTRSAARLAKFDMNLARVMAMNNPGAIAGAASAVTTAPMTYNQALGMTAAQRGGLGATQYAAAQNAQRSMEIAAASMSPEQRLRAGQLNSLGMSLTGAEGAAAVTTGMRRYAAVQGVRGRYSKTFMNAILTSGGGKEMVTAMGTAGMKSFGTGSIQMTDTAEKIIRPLASAMESGLERNAAFRMTAANALGRAVPMTELGAGRLATEVVEKGIIKTLGVRGAAQAASVGGVRVGAAVAGEAALAAIPGVNLVFAADIVYQLAKLAGLGVKAGINFAKDGIKSMQGTMNNDVFGNGYKDNEVAATSRARGVMAIQNSRLNARSMLGSEGALMHAHFG